MGSKRKLFALISLICMLILAANSSVLTGKFFYGLALDNLMGFLIMAGGISLDLGKIIFPIMAGFKLQREKYEAVLGYGIMGLICMVISFFASMAWDLNTNNAIKNEAIMNDTRFTMQSEMFKSTTSTVSDLKKEITSLRSTIEADVKKASEHYKPQLENAKRMNYITTPGIGVNAILEKIRKAEATARAKIETRIKEKETLLQQKEKGLGDINTAFGNLTSNITTTKGVYALAQWMNPKNPDAMVGKINAIKNIVLELAAIAFAFVFGSCTGEMSEHGDFFGKLKKLVDKKKTAPAPNSSTPPPQINGSAAGAISSRAGAETGNSSDLTYGRSDFTPYPEEDIINPVSKKKIGFDIEPSSSLNLGSTKESENETNDKQVSLKKGESSLSLNLEKKFNDQVGEYRRKMEETAEGEIAKGYIKIGKMMKITQAKALEIYGHLKTEKIIEVEGGRTIIKKWL